MSGQWRIIVDSWITPQATWFGRRTFVLDGSNTHSLVAAVQAVADGDFRDHLGEHRFESMTGAAPEADFPASDEFLDTIGKAHPKIPPTDTVLPVPDPGKDDGVREIEHLDAIDTLWSLLTPAQVATLKDERPEVVTMAQAAHETMWHAQRP